MIFTTQFASAAIVNINSRINNESNPVSLLLDAGTYDVTPIGITDGGAYDSWNAWNGGQVTGCNSSGENCSTGWLNLYYFASSEFGEVSIWDVNRYASSSLALANSISTSFTLISSATVDFYIIDGANGSTAWDNVGGISLNVASPVPLPTALYLFLSGVAGLAAIRKKNSI
ncbi:hypothetical protein MNBD_BACTEROID02-1626 [hydrothermal vent metagenome]|uniref:Uncharacterized protein n=1 Tax=hydrothermal vent metagenome TaxID=652676 RepID=A0A3B0RS21_9ZZZZ